MVLYSYGSILPPLGTFPYHRSGSKQKAQWIINEIETPGAFAFALGVSLSLQKAFVFVGGGAADVAYSRQFADVQFPVFVCGIVSQKGGGDVLFAYLRTPDLMSQKSNQTEAANECDPA